MTHSNRIILIIIVTASICFAVYSINDNTKSVAYEIKLSDSNDPVYLEWVADIGYQPKTREELLEYVLTLELDRKILTALVEQKYLKTDKTVYLTKPFKVISIEQNKGQNIADGTIGSITIQVIIQHDNITEEFAVKMKHKGYTVSDSGHSVIEIQKIK